MKHQQHTPDTGPGNGTTQDRTEQACTTELLEESSIKDVEKGQPEAEEPWLCRGTHGSSLQPPENCETSDGHQGQTLHAT